MSNHSKHVRGASRVKKAAVLSGGALMAASPFVVSGQAEAATFNVTTLADSGAGSLRAALDLANANPDVDTITFQSGLSGTITLAGQLEILESVTIQGPSAASVTVDADGNGMAFYVYHQYGSNIEATISGLTITGGTASGIVNWGETLTLDGVVLTGNTTGGNGGGLYSTSDSTDNGVPSLTIKNSTITGNDAGGSGGGIYHGEAVGNLLIADSVISGNTSGGSGGGVYTADPADVAETVDVTIVRSTISGNDSGRHGGGLSFGDADGQVEIIDSTISGNSTRSLGGGIYFYDTDGDGSLRIERCTVSANTAGNDGGGIYLYHLDRPTVISNSTITGNSAGAGGGGISVHDAEYGVTIEHSTVTGNSTTNSVGGGVYVYYNGSETSIDHSIVSGNTASSDYLDAASYEGAMTGSWSIVGDWSGLGSDIRRGADPKLGALADNGGYTQTMLPLEGSVAINAGDPAFAAPPGTDQRGQARVLGGRIDIGAVEVNPDLPPTGGSNGLMAAMGAALLGLGGAMRLSSKRRHRSA